MQLFKNLKFVLMLAVAHVSFTSSAQLSVGLSAGLIKQKVFDPYFGGEISAKYSFTDNFRVGANVGFYRMKSLEYINPQNSELIKVEPNFVPVSVSGEFVFLKKKLKPYVGAHVGLLQQINISEGANYLMSYFNVGPIVGFDFQATERFGLNLNMRYNLSLYKNQSRNETERFSTFSPNIGVFYTF